MAPWRGRLGAPTGRTGPASGRHSGPQGRRGEDPSRRDGSRLGTYPPTADAGGMAPRVAGRSLPTAPRGPHGDKRCLHLDPVGPAGTAPRPPAARLRRAVPGRGRFRGVRLHGTQARGPHAAARCDKRCLPLPGTALLFDSTALRERKPNAEIPAGTAPPRNGESFPPPACGGLCRPEAGVPSRPRASTQSAIRSSARLCQLLRTNAPRSRCRPRFSPAAKSRAHTIGIAFPYRHSLRRVALAIILFVSEFA